MQENPEKTYLPLWFMPEPVKNMPEWTFALAGLGAGVVTRNNPTAALSTSIVGTLAILLTQKEITSFPVLKTILYNGGILVSSALSYKIKQLEHGKIIGSAGALPDGNQQAIPTPDPIPVGYEEVMDILLTDRDKIYIRTGAVIGDYQEWLNPTTDEIKMQRYSAWKSTFKDMSKEDDCKIIDMIKNAVRKGIAPTIFQNTANMEDVIGKFASIYSDAVSDLTDKEIVVKEAYISFRF